MIEAAPGDEAVAALFARTPFAIRHFLGEGAMGTVYEAESRADGAPLAIKLLHRSLGRDAGVRARFLREWRCASAVSHPHLVRHLAQGEVDDRPYLALELVCGGDLERRADRLGGRLPEDELLRLFQQLALGVHALHEAGVVHRDLKPSNLFVHDDGTARVGDFGLACLKDRSDAVTADGLLVGTPDFMAPEQARRDGVVDERSDIYGLGASLYALAVGAAPFGNGSAWSAIGELLTRPFPDPRERRPELSEAFAALVLRACAADPGSRFATARELSAACARALMRAPSPPAAVQGAVAARGAAAMLIIDDDPVIARIYAARLGADGFTTEVAATAAAGLAAARARPPAAILLDLMLPDGDGIEVLRRLRADPATAAVPVVVLSNAFNPERMADARAAGADEALPKSSTPPRAVSTALARHARRSPGGAAAAVAPASPAPPPLESPPDLRPLCEAALRRLEAAVAGLADGARRRDRALAELADSCGGIASAALASGCPEAARLAVAAELLIRHLRSAPIDVTVSTRRTLAAAVDALRHVLASPSAGPAGVQAPRALVVDDDPVTLRTASRALERAGFAVSVEADPHAALRRIGSERFGVLVLDVLMPGLNGGGLAQAARASVPNRATPIVFFTSLAAFAPPPRLGEAPVEVIAKPFPLMELATKALTLASGRAA